FFSQPFFVAEVFTGKAGNNTPLKETIRSFKELCDGKWDHLPESAFMYVGTIEEAAAQAEAAAKAAGGAVPAAAPAAAPKPAPAGGDAEKTAARDKALRVARAKRRLVAHLATLPGGRH